MIQSEEPVGNFWTVLTVILGSQISSRSLNEVRIYRLQPKSATKGEFYDIFLTLIVSSRRHGLQMANEADEVLLGKRLRSQTTAIKNPRKIYLKNCSLRTLSTIALPTSALRKCSRCYWETRSNVKRQHALTRNNQRQKNIIYMKKITFCCGFRL